MPGDRILTCEDITVRFGGHTALDDASIHVDEGEIVGLIGPNGAGKTTLMETISGFRPVQHGRITYRGRDLLALDASARAGLGIGRTLQNVKLFPYLTVLDNIRVALHRHQRGGPGAAMLRLPSLRDEEARVKARAEDLIDTVGMTAFTEKLAS